MAASTEGQYPSQGKGAELRPNPPTPRFFTGASSPKASAALSQGFWAQATGPPRPAPTLACWGLPRYFAEQEQHRAPPTPFAAGLSSSGSSLWLSPTQSLKDPELHQALTHLCPALITGPTHRVPPLNSPLNSPLDYTAPPSDSLAGGQSARGAVWCGHHAGSGHHWQIHSPLCFAP